MTLIASPSGEGLLTNYDELVAGIKGWLHRTDLKARVPEFIALAEAKLNRIAQVGSMDNDITLTVEAGARVVALPSNFTSPLAAWLNDVQPRDPLTMVLPEQLAVVDTPGRPSSWAVDGTIMTLNCPVAKETAITLRYRGGFRLTAAAPVNALLTKYPDLYFYGALLQTAAWARNAESLGLWNEMYNAAVREVNRTESRVRAAAPLRTELAGLLGCR